MLTKFENDMISRAVYALESIAEELRNLRELKTQEVANKNAKEADDPQN